MDNFSIAIILSLVEGITEFLPVSSSAHLILAGQLLGFTGPKASTFEVIIQFGAILAVVVHYWSIFWGMLKPRKYVNFSGGRAIYLLILTTLPASIMGLLFHGLIKEYLFKPVTLVCALVTGAICMIIVEIKHEKPIRLNLDELTPKMALGIGICQCAALWPGFSRSAATIMGGLLLGADRRVAVQYSFICAVPIMFAATSYDLIKNWQLVSEEGVFFILTGLCGSFIAALCAIKFFIALLGKITLIPFAVYRLLLAPAVYYYIVL